MIKATFRFFYGINEYRTLYVYTIELNSIFFVSAFIECTNIVNFLQLADCEILDITIKEHSNI